MKKENLEISMQTRSIYLKQHSNYLKDDTTFKRFYNMVANPSYFHLTSEDFKGKKVLDAGCGNTGYFQVAMHDYGVEHMTCLDLGEEWIDVLKTFLENYGDEGIHNVSYVSGSTDDLPFEDNTFDIVFSNGVLMHLADEDMIERAFNELARVTKPGGYLYVILGCPGGLVEKEILPAIRNYYLSNPLFKNLIDNLSTDDFVELFKFISENSKGTISEFNEDVIKRLFDVDFCTTVQNITQVPTRWIMELSEDYAKSKLEELGFDEIKRCKRFVERKNIRKYVSPLHYETSSKWGKILYGPGNIEFIARKKFKNE